ncbi:MAG: hypothetical protein RL154_352 [Pseudomonadota bacterium]|jgi:chemotaxis protein CheD
MNIVKGTLDSKVVQIASSSIDKEIVGHRAIAIVGGEFAIAPQRSKVGITTLLGSCVAVMLCDNSVGIISMNHFLLPGKGMGESYQYGFDSLSKMIDEMLKLGASKSKMVAKIAGGASLLATKNLNIGNRNVEFARAFCESENIKIVGEHVSGECGRVVLLVGSFETFVRQVANKNVTDGIERENSIRARTLLNIQPIKEMQ